MLLTKYELRSRVLILLCCPEGREQLRVMSQRGLAASLGLRRRLPNLRAKYRNMARAHIIMLRLVRDAELGVPPR